MPQTLRVGFLGAGPVTQAIHLPAINPGRVFDLELPLDQAADSCQAMDQRRAIKVRLRP